MERPSAEELDSGGGFEFRASRRGRLLAREDSWLRGRARRLLGRRGLEVSDLVQDVRLRALGQADGARFPNRDVFRQWLARILGNRVSDLLRRRRPEPVSSGFLDGAIDSTRSPSRRALESERDQGLRDAIAELPERQRRVLELRLWEKLDHGQIGARLGISAGSARMLWQRGLGRIRTRIEAEP